MLRWRVYYDDETVADSNMPVSDVCAEGVIAIVQADDDPTDPYRVGRVLLFDRDFYVWHPHGWSMVDTYGLYDYLRQPGWKKVLAGRTVKRAVYKRIIDRAFHDPDFPVKSAAQAGEVVRG